MNNTIEYFKVNKNPLNGHYMVSSKCEQLVQCYAFKSKKEAMNVAKALNIRVNEDVVKYNVKKTFRD